MSYQFPTQVEPAKDPNHEFKFEASMFVYCFGNIGDALASLKRRGFQQPHKKDHRLHKVFHVLTVWESDHDTFLKDLHAVRGECLG